jgi:putative nucleotidyltransferase with HDIG domain
MEGLAYMDSSRIAESRAAIAALSSAHGHRDPFTCKHEQRVADFAVALASRLGLAAARVEILRMAAVTHDIGKIGVPTEIVGKAGKLSAPEYALMQTHCEIGFDILRQLHSPYPIADIAYQHHERLDGSGYPLGLAGDAIVFEARILAVADVFDAMSSHRSYRAAMPLHAVLAELRSQAGRTLDASIVEACADLSRMYKPPIATDSSVRS